MFSKHAYCPKHRVFSEYKEQHLTQLVFHSYSELFPAHMFYEHEVKFKIRENAVFTVPVLTDDAAD